MRYDFDIESYIMSDAKEMGALKKFGENSHVDTYSKYIIFWDIPTNLLFCGCESWSLY